MHDFESHIIYTFIMHIYLYNGAVLYGPTYWALAPEVWYSGMQCKTRVCTSFANRLSFIRLGKSIRTYTCTEYGKALWMLSIKQLKDTRGPANNNQALNTAIYLQGGVLFRHIFVKRRGVIKLAFQILQTNESLSSNSPNL